MTAQPTSLQERIEAMDVLRGFALLGVFAVNMMFFAFPFQQSLMEPWTKSSQPGFMALLVLLFQGKFYCLFSFLFGMGFAEQMARLEAKGEAPASIYRRRLAWLILIGLAHGLLVWMGDILFAYAVLGFLLPAFRTRQPKTLLRWAFGLLLALALFYLALFGMMKLAPFIPEMAAQMHAAVREEEAGIAKAIQSSLQTYGHGPYGTLFLLRAKELLNNYVITFFGVGPQILAMFLLGAWCSRQGVLRNPEAHRKLITAVIILGLTFGLAGNAFNLWCATKGMPGPANPLSMLGMAVYTFAAPSLTLAYAGLILRGLSGPTAELLKPLAWSGRMALTNYLMHSVLFTFVFYHYGLGLFGKVPPALTFPMALGLWLIQIPLSRAWLARHPMGPAETVWRRLTYR